MSSWKPPHVLETAPSRDGLSSTGPSVGNLAGFRVIIIYGYSGLATKLGDLSWVSVGRLCSPAKPAKVSLALDSPHVPTEEEGWGVGLGFAVLWVLCKAFSGACGGCLTKFLGASLGKGCYAASSEFWRVRRRAHGS